MFIYLRGIFVGTACYISLYELVKLERNLVIAPSTMVVDILLMRLFIYIVHIDYENKTLT